MLYKLLLLLLIFLIGEIIINNTLFRYIRKYFQAPASSGNKHFMGFDISTFKGLLERFVLFVALLLNFSQILIVFGAIKIGTRIDDKSVKVNNDYFIIGNFFTLLIAFLYWFIYKKALAYDPLITAAKNIGLL